MSKAKTLDQFFGTSPPTTAAAERCSNSHCRKLLTETDIKYHITKKGETKVYCQPCAKAILKPQESAETI